MGDIADFLHIASTNDAPGLANLLASGADPNTVPNLVCWLASTGRSQLLEIVVAHGADIEVELENIELHIKTLDWTHTTKESLVKRTFPLAVAANEGHADCCRVLLRYGAHVDQRNSSFGYTPLIRACVNGRMECASVLLDAGANIEGKNTAGRTPLIKAAHYDRPELCQYLIQRGAKLETCDNNGKTPLVYASNGRSLASAVVLLGSGADARAGEWVWFQNYNRGTTREVWITSLQRLARSSPEVEPDQVQVLEDAHKRGGNRALIRLILSWLAASDPGKLAVVQHWHPERSDAVIRWRQAVEANRDARRVFKAASEGRPMELAKRLRLGKLAGGLEIKGAVAGGPKGLMSPLEAARLGRHDECARVLEEVLAGNKG